MGEFASSWVFDEGDPEEIYILEEEVASGTFGTVYKSRHSEQGYYVALKILKPEDEDDAMSDFVELHILKNCDHKNIVKLYGSWKKADETFIAIEWCGGGAVSDFNAVWNIQLTEDQIALICRETLVGLKYLHSINIIHRDIKGANILINEEGDVKLIDFGVSAILRDPSERRKTLIGTPYWMAPEIINNKTRESPYDEKVDIWSVGITLIELAEKDPPLSQMNPMRALMQIPLREPPSLQQPEKWSESMNDFVHLCLQRDPKKRPSVDELLNHPFLKNPKPKTILVDLINRAKKEKARILQQELTEEPSPVAAQEVNAPVESTEESSTGAGLSPIKKDEDKDGNSEEEFSSFSNSDDGNDTDPGSPTNEAKNNSHPSTPSNGTKVSQVDNADQNQDDAKLGVRPTNIRSNKDRPTMKNSTQREREIKSKASSTKLIQQQLKELRNQSKKHTAEMERFKAKNRDLEQATIKKYKGKEQRLKEKTNMILAKQSRQIDADIKGLERKHADDKRQLPREAEERDKHANKKVFDSCKDLSRNYKQQQAKVLQHMMTAFREESKQKKLNLKSDLKKKEREKAVKLIKEEVTEWNKFLEQSHDLNILRFKQELRRIKLEENYSLQWFNQYELEKLIYTFHKEYKSLQLQQCETSYRCAIEIKNEELKLEMEEMGQKHPLMQQITKKEQELELKHLLKTQQVEKEQQVELLSFDHRTELRDFKKSKQSEEKKFMNSIKNFKNEHRKTLSSEDIKKQTMQMKQKWDNDLLIQEKNFVQKQKEQEEEEVNLLKTQHEAQVTRLKIIFEENMTSLIKNQQQHKSKVQEEYHQVLDNLETQFWLAKLAITANTQAEFFKAVDSCHKQQLKIVSTEQTEEFELYKQFIEEIQALCTEQNRSDQEKSEIIDSLNHYIEYRANIQSEKIAVLKLVQSEELHQIKKEHKIELDKTIESSPNRILKTYSKIEDDGSLTLFPPLTLSTIPVVVLLTKQSTSLTSNSNPGLDTTLSQSNPPSSISDLPLKTEDSSQQQTTSSPNLNLASSNNVVSESHEHNENLELDEKTKKKKPESTSRSSKYKKKDDAPL
eukprot:TRINITY_DN286_c1_g2_i1.p1 TRINITY_DN286_c1_g2~~TRINITY_DN286_c1_g2_i1.p1  ORF type:complete len:1074 (+),score=293.77 TRINITY_DN286_c1_g2_i1:18-3239(+)